MHLAGSCHCGAVRFSVEAQSPVPFMHCHCSICRKTAGSGGFAINLGAKSATLKVRGDRVKLLQYVAAQRALLHCVTSLDTAFPERFDSLSGRA